MKRLRFLLPVLVIAVLFFPGPLARAQDFTISGNGTGSQNGVNVQNDTSVNLHQENSQTINTNANATGQSGGNNISGGTNGNSVIKTGGVTTTVDVVNKAGQNSATVNNCCGTPTPTLTPTPASTPTSGGGGIGGGGSSGGGSSSSGDGGGVGGGSVTPAVMGLSATAGPENEQYIFYALGLLCLGFGGKILAPVKRQNG